MDFKKALTTALTVTLAAQTLDIMVHLATDVTIHLPYILAKTTVIAVTLLFFNYWIGMDWKNGIVAVLAATTIFYAYYRFTEPTLDRTVFTLDEQVIWILVHFIAVYIPYWLTLKTIDKNLMAARVVYAIRNWVYLVAGGLVVASLFLLPTKQFLKDSNLLLGLRYNDHVAVGTLALIVATVALYKLIILKLKK